MSEISIDIPHYSGSCKNMLNTNLTPIHGICICCLNKSACFIILSTCKHVYLIEYFVKLKVEYRSSVICQSCHCFVKKIELFKQQVEVSLMTLDEKIQYARPHIKFQNLLFTQPLITSYGTEDLKDDATNTLYEHFTTDVKVEHESSDFEIDVPLSELKQEICKEKIKKRKTAKSKGAKKPAAKPKKKVTIDEMCKGKISIVSLTAEEMTEERRLMATKESYLKLPYKCESCITGFDHELTLKEHIEKRHGVKKDGYICEICKSVLGTKSSYNEHSKRHTRRYECQECGKRNCNIYSSIKHYNEQHGRIDTQFTCQECGFTTTSHRRYRYHRDKHNQKQQCSLCDSTFVNSTGLKVHMFTVHKQSDRVYSCEQCKKIYNAKSGLVAHMASVHSDHQNAAYCTTCRTYYRSANNLVHHLKTHSAHVKDTDKKFICDECGAKFVAKISLQEHIDYVHLKSDKHQCAKCCKVFINTSALKKHDNYVHKKIRPPRNKICDHCGRGFTTLAILSSHVRTHTGARPLHCAHCPATFAHSAALYTHNKLLHGGKRQK